MVTPTEAGPRLSSAHIRSLPGSIDNVISNPRSPLGVDFSLKQIAHGIYIGHSSKEWLQPYFAFLVDLAKRRLKRRITFDGAVATIIGFDLKGIDVPEPNGANFRVAISGDYQRMTVGKGVVGSFTLEHIENEHIAEEENRNDGEDEQEHHPRRKVSRKKIANNDTGWNPTPNQKEWDKEKERFRELEASMRAPGPEQRLTWFERCLDELIWIGFHVVSLFIQHLHRHGE
jgi:hypothetical protein